MSGKSINALRAINLFYPFYLFYRRGAPFIAAEQLFYLAVRPQKQTARFRGRHCSLFIAFCPHLHSNNYTLNTKTAAHPCGQAAAFINHIK
jgi:hypothetical protein